MDYRRIGIVLLIAVLLFSALPVFAQEPSDPLLTWDDSLNPRPIRHIGDWMVNAGWYSPEEIYGPFTEAEFTVGDRSEFTASTFAAIPRSFELRYVSKTAYFWFELDTQPDEDALVAAGEYFDAVAVPFIHATFGDSTGPGIDGDPRVHIVHENFIDFGAVGVFRPEDQCGRVVCTESNQRDAIYYSLDWGAVNTPEHLTTITHEYQHLIRFQQDGNERRWMNEGLSQLAEHLTGSTPDQAAGDNLESYLSAPNFQLESWNDFTIGAGRFYGSSYLFMVYLFERFGLDFIRALSSSPYDGLAAVHHSLAELPQPQTLNAVFGDWLIANYLDNPFAADGQYYYAGLDLPRRIGATTVMFPPSSEMTYARDANQYGVEYFELEAGTYDILFEGATQTDLTGAMPRDGERAWWGYNAESSITTLTHPFDLSALERATLEYSIWHDTEFDYDWVDVMISVDEGVYWKPLQSEHMQPASDFIPVAHYTGRSAGWLDEHIDLTPYTGQSILLRFEYITNGTVTYGGVLVDNIAVPELDFADDTESDGAGWAVDGFFRGPLVVAQDWLVAYISLGERPTVEIFDLSAENTARQRITVPEDGGVIVVSAMAPITIQESDYKLVIQASP